MSALRSIIIGVIAIYMIASLAPGAITALTDANTTGWGAQEVALWGVTGVLAVLGFVVMIVKPALDETGGL